MEIKNGKNLGSVIIGITCVTVLVAIVAVSGIVYKKNLENENTEREGQIPTSLEVGDYVSYTADVDASKSWRVWEIDESSGKVIIVPTGSVGSLTLSGISGDNGWLNAETAIENECDKYINDSLGITAEDIRSMKIEDIEKVIAEYNVAEGKEIYFYGKDYSYNEGTFYAEKANDGEETFDGYNKILSNPRTATSSDPVTIVTTCWDYRNDLFDGGGNDISPTWNSISNTKTGMTNETYGNLLGNCWLSSRCIKNSFSPIDPACFCVYAVDSSKNVVFHLLYESVEYYHYPDYYTKTHGVRPLVSISATLFTGDGQGTSTSPWKLAK